MPKTGKATLPVAKDGNDLVRIAGSLPSRSRGRPEWVPDWAWDEFTSARDNKLPYGSDTCIETFEKIIRSEHTKRIWSALGKRRDIFEEHNDIVESFSPAGVALELALTADRALLAFPEITKLNNKEVRRASKKIANLASQLAKRIQATDYKKSAQFTLFYLNLKSFLARTLKTLPAGELNEEELIAVSRPDVKAGRRLAANIVQIIHFVAIAATHNSAFEDMRAPKRTKDAARLHFLKWMRIYFAHVYHSPLHETNLALASVFFDCSNLTPTKIATITKPKSKKATSSS